MPGFMASNVSMTICEFEKGVPLDVDALRKQAFSDAIDPDGFRSGWVGMGQLLDTENFFLALTDGLFSGFSYRLDTRKPAKAVVQLQLAEKIRAEEAEGRKVGAKRKKELREAIVESLTSQADFVPTLTDCVWDAEKGRLLIATVSESLAERILENFSTLIGQQGHFAEASADMREVFAKIQNDNGIRAGEYFIQSTGSAQMTGDAEDGEKSAITAQNNVAAISEALGKGLQIYKMGLIASKNDEDDPLEFTLEENLRLSRIRLPKAEKGAEEDAVFLVNCSLLSEAADIAQMLAAADK